MNLISLLRFKFTVMLASALLIIGSFGITLSRFNSTDVEPSLKEVSVEAAREFVGFAVHVETGLFVRSFSYFNIIENRFIADMVVWFIFNPTEISIETIEKFTIENGQILKKSPPDVKFINEKMFVKYDIVAELRGNLEYRKFPFDDHRLAIVLTNNFVTPSEVMLEVFPTNFVVAPDIFVANWTAKRLSTNFGIDENVLNQADPSRKISYPKVIFTIDFAKAGIKNVFIIFLPILVMFFFSLFSFFLTIPNTIGRITLVVSALTALLGYRFVIENMMPKVGYFTTTDYIYLILLFFSFINFALQVVLTKLYSSHDEAHKKAPVRKYQFAADIFFMIITGISTVLICFVLVC